MVRVIDNQDRADWGDAAVVAAASQTGAHLTSPAGFVVLEVLAYMAHFCARLGLDVEETFSSGMRSFYGDEEDGPFVKWTRKVEEPFEHGPVRPELYPLHGRVLTNEDRADLGQAAVVAAARATNVYIVETARTSVTDVLAYVGHVCCALGMDAERTFATALTMYNGEVASDGRVEEKLDGERALVELLEPGYAGE